MIPDYEHGILQAVNTIRNKIGLPCYYQMDALVEQWLSDHQFQQVMILLIDGMGYDQVESYCKADGFLKTHLAKPIDTVYPPTTVAATTAVLTGKAPCETGWLAWNQYFSSIDRHAVMFFNEDHYSELPLDDPMFSYHQFPITTMVEECCSCGIQARELFPSWRTPGMDSFAKLCREIVKESKQQSNRFVYAYWDEYDSFMHDHGASHPDSIRMLQEYDELLESTMSELSNQTGLMIIADHGHIDVVSKHLIEYPDLLDCFAHLPAFEARTLNFFIKEDKKERFQTLFLSAFGEDFKLLTKQEVLDQQLFGKGCAHARFEEMLGDFIACATGSVELTYQASFDLKGHHAGMTKEEIEIPLILIP